jgi:sugar-specific transcriptional regulator TrmB
VPDADRPATGALEGLGVTPLEERMYRVLLRTEGGGAAELAAKLRVTARRASGALAGLEEKGMATHSPQRVRRYFALPPDVALEALTAWHQRDALERHRRARAALEKLGRSIKSRNDVRRTSDRVVEIISPQVSAQMFSQMHRTARSEIICMLREPMLVTVLGEPDPVVHECLDRGVRCRTLVDGALLKMDGTREHFRREAERGELMRIASPVPFKLVLADARIGILPLNLSHPAGPTLLVRSSSLLDALYLMFEMLWRDATPFTPGDPTASKSDDQGGAALLPLLVSGLNDKAIMHELGVSHRTVSRRIVELMEGVGANTRFQAGWLAARASDRRDGE